MEEEEVYRTRNSRKLYIPIYVMIFILFGTIAFIQFSGRELNILALQATIIFSFLVLLITELHRFNNLYEIHSNALVHVKGLLKKVIRRTDLLAVSDADQSQNLWQMMLRYGNVSVRVFSQDSTMYVRNIDNPSAFIEFLEDKMSKKRSTGSGGGGGMGR